MASRWISVAGKRRSLLKHVEASNRIRRQQIDLTANQTDQICQQLARDGKNSRLEASISEMKRTRKAPAFAAARRRPRRTLR